MLRSDWLETTDVCRMLKFLNGRDDWRKMQLFVIECCRRVLHTLPEEPYSSVMALAERQAEDACSKADMWDAIRDVTAAKSTLPFDSLAQVLVTELFKQAVLHDVSALNLSALFGRDRNPTGVDSEWGAQAAILRDLHGPLPFRPPPFDGPLEGRAFDLARTIYDQREFWRMPVLGDALYEAGIADQDVLAHCHEPGFHARGCWVLDLVINGPTHPCQHLARFAKIVPTPVDVPKPLRSWNTAERLTGCTYPSDFKEFVDMYGPGCLGDAIIVESPIHSVTVAPSRDGEPAVLGRFGSGEVIRFENELESIGVRDEVRGETYMTDLDFVAFLIDQVMEDRQLAEQGFRGDRIRRREYLNTLTDNRRSPAGADSG